MQRAFTKCQTTRKSQHSFKNKEKNYDTYKEIYLCSFFYFYIISNLQKYFENNTNNSYFVYILPVSSVICSLHVHAHTLFSEPFVNKFQTLCSFTKHFSVYFFKNKDISFHSHSTTIKTRTFNIDIFLLLIPKVILFPCCHKCSPTQLSFFANYIFHILV